MADIEIAVRNVTALRGGATILSGIDLEVESGRLVALVGPSGCGKTTLMRAMAGLDPVHEGTVRIGGVDAGTALRQGRISMAFQDPALLPWLTCWANAGWLAQMRSNRFPAARVAELAELVSLDCQSDLKDKYPNAMSGGERQRVALIRAMSADSPVLLLDEPFSALDYQRRVQIVAKLREMLVRAGATCVLVTHDLRDATHFADEIVAYNVDTSRFDKQRRIDLKERGARIRDQEDFTRTLTDLTTWAA